MTRQTKIGSSRRKGDEYQDLTALQLVLEHYIAGGEFSLSIEYEKAGSFDDVFVVLPEKVEGYQIKHAVSPSAVYTKEDLLGEDSVVNIKKFSDSWLKISSDHPDHEIVLYLRSNRGYDSFLGSIVDRDGRFDQSFCENRYRKDKGSFREQLRETTELTEEQFKEFLQCFHFDLNRPSWIDLERHIQAVLLDHELGISDRHVFSDLKSLIEKHAIESFEPITADMVDSQFKATHSRYMLPQVFPVDKSRFVEPPGLAHQLSDKLSSVDGDYIVVTGPPGSGKSTAISTFFDELEYDKPGEFAVVHYYCFVGVNDNLQQLRLQANSLRVNLLCELQRSFPEILDTRRFDFSEQHFQDALNKVGESCNNDGKKLVVYLDGLDHVERDPDIRESVIGALPNALPRGVIFVIGTQELHNWKPLGLRSGRADNHVPMPLFSPCETAEYIKRCGIVVDEGLLTEIHRKSNGLPLYLRYLAELLSESENLGADLQLIPDIEDGDIHGYYTMLWAAFDTDGKDNAKYLSTVLCCLYFRAHEEELFDLQEGLSRPLFEGSFRHVRHLLRVDEGLVSVFHDSFRVFVLKQTHDATKREIYKCILSHLQKEERQSGRWFKHALSYAIDALEYSYVIQQVDRSLVDCSLLHFRDKEEIMNSIDLGVKAAGKISDLRQLVRIGTLKYRTSERIDFDFPWEIMSEILVRQGRLDEVLGSIRSDELNMIAGPEPQSLTTILEIWDSGHRELSEKLFVAFLDDFKDYDGLGPQGILDLARCAGLFPRVVKLSSIIRWLDDNRPRCGVLDFRELTPEHAPHLASYISGLVDSGAMNVWRRLRRLQGPFDNSLMRHLIIRALADTGRIELLREELAEYIKEHPDVSNVQLGFYGAKAGLPPDQVGQLGGIYKHPPEEVSHDTFQHEVHLFAHWCVILEYCSDQKTLDALDTHIGTSDTVWACTQRYLIRVGKIVGCHFANRETDWLNELRSAVGELEVAADVPGERTRDAQETCRAVLPQTLYWLSDVLCIRSISDLPTWGDLLRRLRESLIWTLHYGISEYQTDYSFELLIWRKQSKLPAMRRILGNILEDCARDYSAALSLKGSSRGYHFISLSALAQRCGFRRHADNWMEAGISASLTYGYRKDTTISNLISMVKLLDSYKPENTLQLCSDILEMVKWMPDATDGRMTKHFAQEVFPVVLYRDRKAALKLLTLLYDNFSKWQADECLTDYILDSQDTNLPYLWALTFLLPPNESLKARQHISTVGDTVEDRGWNDRFCRYVKTTVNPRHWTADIWNSLECHRERKVETDSGTPNVAEERKYSLDGQLLSSDELVDICSESFGQMVEVLDKLKSQNEFTPDTTILGKLLPGFISGATDREDLTRILDFHVASYSTLDYGENYYAIGMKLLELGDDTGGLKCMESAIHDGKIREPLRTLANYDPVRARAVICEALHSKLCQEAYHGFGVSKSAADACDILGETELLEAITHDYLSDCKELFDCFPDENHFSALHQWDGTGPEEREQIVHLLIDQLGCPAIVYTDQLVLAIGELVAEDGGLVLPVVVDRIMAAEGILLDRLLMLLHNIAHAEPEKFRLYCEPLATMIERENFYMKSLMCDAFEGAFEDDNLPTEVHKAIQRVAREYSPSVKYSSFRITKGFPSSEFRKLLRLGTITPFQRQIETICEVLKIDHMSCLAHLERSFLDTGHSTSDSMDSVRELRRAFTHAQGWPAIAVKTDVEIKLKELFYKFLDEVFRKLPFSSECWDAIWRIIQPSDPGYHAAALSPKPEDIEALSVEDKDRWFAVSENPQEHIAELSQDQWVTVYEYHQTAQDSPYHVEYISQTHVDSVLVDPAIHPNGNLLPELSWSEFVGIFHPLECFSSRQFKDALLHGKTFFPDNTEGIIPLVCTSKRQLGFVGFISHACFSSPVMKMFSLDIDANQVLYDGQLVGRYEAWQEGWPDEDYNDQPLSLGVRLSATTDFLHQVVELTGCNLVTRTVENRFAMKAYKMEPEESVSTTTFKRWRI